MLLLRSPFADEVLLSQHKHMRFYALQEGLLPPVKTASVTLCDLGASVVSIKVPDKNGSIRDVVLG